MSDNDQSDEAPSTQLTKEQREQQLTAQIQQILQQVRKRSAINRECMINKHERRHSAVTFVIGDNYVTLYIPQQDRSATYDRRLPARIIGKNHIRIDINFKTMEGILKNSYNTRHLDPVPMGVLPEMPDNPAVITLLEVLLADYGGYEAENQADEKRGTYLLG